jgi:hypothetical protein
MMDAPVNPMPIAQKAAVSKELAAPQDVHKEQPSAMNNASTSNKTPFTVALARKNAQKIKIVHKASVSIKMPASPNKLAATTNASIPKATPRTAALATNAVHLAKPVSSETANPKHLAHPICAFVLTAALTSTAITNIAEPATTAVHRAKTAQEDSASSTPVLREKPSAMALVSICSKIPITAVLVASPAPNPA